jgi:pimeloyl-ACP methyl ester carboxylesterase
MPPPTFAQWWGRLEANAKRSHYPFHFVPYEDSARVMDKVVPQFDADRESWTREYAAAAAPHERRAAEAEAKGDKKTAREAYLNAYGLYHMARMPCPNTPGKKTAYAKSQENLLKAYSFDSSPVKRIEMPFKGRAGEGDKVIGLPRRPQGVSRPPVLIAWAGIDSFKEEWMLRCDPFFARGIAILAVDMPGAGNSPVLASEDGERQWTAMLDWIAAQPDLDSSRVGAWGGSDGGYWATKIAHTHRERLTAVISQGGGCHKLFTKEWIEQAQQHSHPWGIAQCRGNTIGKPDYDAWVAFAPRMSLLTQGVLDKPCAPLLCIQRRQGPDHAHRGLLHRARARRAQMGALLPRRPHGHGGRRQPGPHRPDHGRLDIGTAGRVDVGRASGSA